MAAQLVFNATEPFAYGGCKLEARRLAARLQIQGTVPDFARALFLRCILLEQQQQIEFLLAGPARDYHTLQHPVRAGAPLRGHLEAPERPPHGAVDQPVAEPLAVYFHASLGLVGGKVVFQ